MKKRDRKALAEYVRSVANEIGLRDWEIVIRTEGVQLDGSTAEIEALDGRRLAYIDFVKDFRERDRTTQRSVVVHELLHCHLTPAQHQVEHDLEGILGGQADAVFSTTFRRNLEYAVDAIAAALAPHLPLIDWPE